MGELRTTDQKVRSSSPFGRASSTVPLTSAKQQSRIKWQHRSSLSIKPSMIHTYTRAWLAVSRLRSRHGLGSKRITGCGPCCVTAISGADGFPNLAHPRCGECAADRTHARDRPNRSGHRREANLEWLQGRGPVSRCIGLSIVCPACIGVEPDDDDIDVQLATSAGQLRGAGVAQRDGRSGSRAV